MPQGAASLGGSRKQWGAWGAWYRTCLPPARNQPGGRFHAEQYLSSVPSVQGCTPSALTVHRGGRRYPAQLFQASLMTRMQAQHTEHCTLHIDEQRNLKWQGPQQRHEYPSGVSSGTYRNRGGETHNGRRCILGRAAARDAGWR